MSIIFYLIQKSLYFKSYNYKLHPLFLVFMILIEFLLHFNNNYVFFVIIELLITNSISDILNFDVYTIFNILLFIYSSILSKSFNLYLILGFFFLTFLKTKHIGSGDIEVLFSISPLFSLYQLIKILFLASSFALAYMCIFRKNKIPFVPFLSFSIVIMLFLPSI